MSYHYFAELQAMLYRGHQGSRVPPVPRKGGLWNERGALVIEYTLTLKIKSIFQMKN